MPTPVVPTFFADAADNGHELYPVGMTTTNTDLCEPSPVDDGIALDLSIDSTTGGPYLQVAAADATPFAINAFSLAMLIRPGSIGAGKGLAEHQGFWRWTLQTNRTLNAFLSFSSGGFGGGGFDISETTTAVVPNDAAWHLVVLRVQVGTVPQVSISIDTTHKDNGVSTTGTPTSRSGNPLNIAENNLRDPYVGGVDEIAFWNRRLSDAEVNDLAAALAAGSGYAAELFALTPMAYWPLDDGCPQLPGGWMLAEASY